MICTLAPFDGQDRFFWSSFILRWSSLLRDQLVEVLALWRYPLQAITVTLTNSSNLPLISCNLDSNSYVSRFFIQNFVCTLDILLELLCSFSSNIAFCLSISKQHKFLLRELSLFHEEKLTTLSIQLSLFSLEYTTLSSFIKSKFILNSSRNLDLNLNIEA